MYRQFIIALNLLILLLLHSAWGQEKYQESATLFPGDSHVFNGVKVEWRVGGEAPTTESPNVIPGDLVITGPDSGPVSFSARDLILVNEQDNPVSIRSTTNVFVDGVIFYFDGSIRQVNELSAFSLKVRAFESPVHTDLSAEMDNGEIHVSAWTPVTINEFRLSYSDEKKTLADGAEYYMLKVDNDAQNIHEEIPIAPNAQRKIGRFSFYLRPDDFGRTTTVKFDADQDLSARGRDALVTDWDYEARFGRGYLPIKAFFDLFSERHGFTIEWKDQEGFPGSAEEVQTFKIIPNRPRSGTRGGKPYYSPVSSVIDQMDNETNQVWIPDVAYLKLLDFSWESPTKLVAQVINMEELAERRAQKQEQQKKNDETKTEFESEYKLMTRAYPVASITAETALDLIRPDLKTWHLKSRSEGTIVFISTSADETHSKILDSRAESAILAADQNAIILTAIPKHHALFEERLANIDKALSATAKSASGRPHQLIVTLLVGSQEAKSAGESSEMGDLGSIRWDPALAEKFGLSAEDIDAFGIKTLGRAGVGMVSLLPEKGEAGHASVALSPAYSAELEFEDMREPYLVLRGRLLHQPKLTAAEAPPTVDPFMSGGEFMGMGMPSKAVARVLMQNTLYLQPGRSEMLGVTNLREALILVVEWRADKP